jgi:hypothetical protein
MHFCRKADPESKGKVENAVQYVKKNFLYNRLYSDLQTLNEQAVAWLDRTANHLPHNYTKKSPASEFMIEKQYLNPYSPMTIENKEQKTYSLRKNNTINYHSNFYTVPAGTYTRPGEKVIVKQNDGVIEIYSVNNKLICTHKLSLLTGQTISNTNHKRDTSKSLDKMMQKAAGYFSDKNMAMDYFMKIKKKLPRYTRDNLQVILKSLTSIEKETADKTLSFCQQNSVFNANEWKDVLQTFLHESLNEMPGESQVRPLNESNFEKINQMPQVSNIEDYEKIINAARH